MITELTEEQSRLIEVYRDKWMDIGLSVEDMSDEETYQILDELYSVLEKENPKKLILDSPIQCSIAYAILENKEQILDTVSDKILAEINKS